MAIKVERIEKNQVSLEFQIEATDFSNAISQAFKKVAGKVNIPGFRKGKVPRQILENYVGKEALYDEALEQVLPGAYFNAVKEAEIEPIDRPQVEVVELEEGKPVIIKAKVQVKPEVTLGDYKGVKVEKPNNEVSEAEIDNYIEGLRQRHAKVNILEEGTVEQGDTAVIDFEGFVDGVAFEGGKGESYSLEIGSNSFIPGFEDQLIGAAAGEERDVNVTFPEEYHAEDLKGKPALFKVKINSIKRKELLPLDDEFAKDVSEFETIAELKADAKNKLEEAAKDTSKRELQNKVIDAVVATAEVEIPEVMVEQKQEVILSNMAQRLQYQGLTMEQYYQFSGTTEEQLKEQNKDDAIRGVKVDLVLEAIAQKEGISCTEEDIDQEVAKMAEQYNQEPDKVRQIIASQGNLDNLKYSITMEKAIDFLVENADIQEKTAE
ncbi:MAG: trigger factor [Bacillota bacterium]|nr:trigger factor [Bacillota bacterium]